MIGKRKCHVSLKLDAGKPLPEPVARLLALRTSTDPFELARTIEHKLGRIEQVQNGLVIEPRRTPPRRTAAPLPPRRSRAALELSYA